MRLPTSKNIIQAGAFSVFAGRALQHLFFDAPYREILWDEALFGPVIEWVPGLSWSMWLTDVHYDRAIQQGIVCLGVYYGLCAVLTLFPKWMAKLRGLVWVGVLGLVLLAAAYTKSHFYHLGQFFEYAAQVTIPLLWMYWPSEGMPGRRWELAGATAVSLTFLCHGLYALGFYPVPGTFLTMTTQILGVDTTGAKAFLLVAGWLDVVVAVGVFLPWRWRRLVLVYAVAWGLATAMARIVGNFYWEFPWESLWVAFPEALYRFPHFLLPLALWRLHAGGPSPIQHGATD